MKRLGSLVIGTLVGGAALAGCTREAPYQPPPTPVRAQAVEMYSATGGLRYSATVRPYTQVESAFRIGGYVEAILQVMPGSDARRRDVQEGDRVARDTVLARVRGADYEVKVNQAKAYLAEAVAAAEAAHSQLAEAEAASEAAQSQLVEALAASEGAQSQLAEALAGWQQARLDLDRATKLLETRSIVKPEYDAANARAEVMQAKVEGARAQLAGIQARVQTARAQVRMSQAKVAAARAQPQLAQAGVNRARAQIEEAEIARRDAALRAPIDGVVLKRSVEVGTLVGPGVPAFVVADTSSVKVVFGVPDVMVGKMKLGSVHSITTEAIPGVEFRGRLTRVSPAADPKSRIFEVELTIPNPRDQLRIGMIATLEVANAASPDPVPVVPLSAIVRPKTDASGYAVFVVEERDGRGTARLRRVKLGEAFGNMIAVTEGVRAGERVIGTGATLVEDGQPVQVLP